LLLTTAAADQHFGSTNGNATDSNWMFVISGDVGATTNLITGPLPSALYNEGFFVSPPYNADGSVNSARAIRRAFHSYNSGWDTTFDVQNGIAMISQTGRFALLSTDGMGQFGSLAGGAACNVGGPDWSGGSAYFQAGGQVFPQANNTADYIYRVESCSGGCTTGTTAPSWPQTYDPLNPPTVSDGTITWVNTGLVQNCRADVMVVKLTR
jgi:hypothetical protein